uniref:Uncharacterized protein n=1 Tax=Fagus sylvatica TaxID=28930 RepID=A0A2N9FEB0_FAGSY
MFSRTIIYLDVAAVGSSIDSSQMWCPWVVQVGHPNLRASWELMLTEPVLANSKVLFTICSTNAIRAGMSTILFVFIASLILSSIGIKSTRNCKLQTHYSIEVWVPSGSIWELKPYWARKVSASSLPSEILSSTVSTIRLHALSGCLGMSESATAHCQRTVPSFSSTFAGGSWGPLSHCTFQIPEALNLGGIVMLGNQDMLEKSVFPKEFKPCMSLDLLLQAINLAVQLGVFPL